MKQKKIFQPSLRIKVQLGFMLLRCTVCPFWFSSNKRGRRMFYGARWEHKPNMKLDTNAEIKTLALPKRFPSGLLCSITHFNSWMDLKVSHFVTYLLFGSRIFFNRCSKDKISTKVRYIHRGRTYNLFFCSTSLPLTSARLSWSTFKLFHHPLCPRSV